LIRFQNIVFTTLVYNRRKKNGMSPPASVACRRNQK